MRFFTTECSANRADHYCVLSLAREGPAELLTLIGQKQHILLLARRQTSNLLCILVRADYPNREGQYRAICANVEVAQAAREYVTMGMTTVVDQISRRAGDQIADRQATTLASTWQPTGQHNGLLFSVCGVWGG